MVKLCPNMSEGGSQILFKLGKATLYLCEYAYMVFKKGLMLNFHHHFNFLEKNVPRKLQTPTFSKCIATNADFFLKILTKLWQASNHTGNMVCLL